MGGLGEQNVFARVDAWVIIAVLCWSSSVLKYKAARKAHRLINKERHKRGLQHVYWSKEMYRLAKSQASYCAKVGKLIHSNRFAFEGGENLCGGKGNFSPETIVKTWMRSKAGHRENLLSPRARKAAVAIATSKRGTYAAWSFSAHTPDHKDCPYYKAKRARPKNPFKSTVKGDSWMLRIPVKILLIIISIFAIVLGAHGIYVYASRLEVLFGAEPSKLFFAVTMPAGLRDVVEWMSVKGFESWLIPAAFIAIGIGIWYWQSRI